VEAGAGRGRGRRRLLHPLAQRIVEIVGIGRAVEAHLGEAVGLVVGKAVGGAAGSVGGDVAKLNLVQCHRNSGIRVD